MNFEILYHPSPLLIPAFLLVILFVRCYRCNQWPGTDKLIEIIAFSAGIFAASAMLLKAFSEYAKDQQMAWVIFTGAAVTGFVSVRGAWVVFSSINRRFVPKANGDSSTQTEEGYPANQEERDDLTPNKND